MTQMALHTERMTKYYGDFLALHNLTLAVEPGEIYGFLGPNGAGKTTAIRTLMDEIRPSSGSATMLGLDTHRDSLAIRSFLGYLPADLALYPRLTGTQTLAFFAHLRGGVDQEYLQELTERFQAPLAKRVGEMSTGNRQKIGILQAFMNRPRLLIMDEPSAGLDPLMQRELQDLMREVAGAGTAIFLSSHTLSEVQRVADRVGIIRRGELVAEEAVATLNHGGIRQVDLVLTAVVSPDVFTDLPGVSNLQVNQTRVHLTFSGTMDELLAAVAPYAGIVDITTHEPDLEQIFLTYYAEPVLEA